MDSVQAESRCVICYHLRGTSAANVRFAISPIHEAVSLVRMAMEPQRHPLHAPWLGRRARPIAAAETTILWPLMRPGHYRPDFLDPPLGGADHTFYDGLRALLATPISQVQAELHDSLDGSASAAAKELLADPERTRDACAAALQRLWDGVLASEWAALRLVLATDLLHRGQTLTRGGVAGMIGQLHSGVALNGSTVEVAAPVDIDVDCDEGLLLVPTIFITDRVQCVTADHWPATLYYPAHGVWALWQRPAASDVLASLLGARRAQALVSLEVPRSTRGVAEVVGIAPATASEHLTVLRGAGLATRRRLGRQVVHTRTTLGDALVQPTGSASGS